MVTLIWKNLADTNVPRSRLFSSDGTLCVKLAFILKFQKKSLMGVCAHECASVCVCWAGGRERARARGTKQRSKCNKMLITGESFYPFGKFSLHLKLFQNELLKKIIFKRENSRRELVTIENFSKEFFYKGESCGNV